MINALVLSGGSSHGDFEVGAVRRLFEAGFEPALIVSASVGSINGVKLSEMGALAVAGARSGLEQIWLGLQANSFMWTKNPDFDTSALTPLVNQLKATGLNLQEDYTWRIWAEAGAGAASGAVLGGPVGSLAGAAIGLLIGIFQSGSDASALAAEAGTLMGAVQKIMQARSLYTLDPISKALFADINPATVKNSSIRLLMAIVSLESGDLRYVTNSGAVMQEDTTTPYSEQQSVSPTCQDDLGTYNDAVANLRETLGSRGDYSS